MAPIKDDWKRTIKFVISDLHVDKNYDEICGQTDNLLFFIKS